MFGLVKVKSYFSISYKRVNVNPSTYKGTPQQRAEDQVRNAKNALAFRAWVKSKHMVVRGYATQELAESALSKMTPPMPCVVEEYSPL